MYLDLMGSQTKNFYDAKDNPILILILERYYFIR